MKQQFILNDENVVFAEVIQQTSVRYNEMSIQISKVLDLSVVEICDGYAKVGFAYIYEEIDSNDMVIYARFMGYENIKKNYTWAL